MNRRLPGILMISVFAFLFVFSFNVSNAADPEFLVTWKAQTKVPVWYQGKALVVKDSSVLISFSLIDQNGTNEGKLVDLSNSEVRWYLKGDLAQKGKGLTSLSVLNKDFGGNYIDLKISVQYSDASGGERFVDDFRTIHIVQPETVIEYKNLQPFFSAGSDVILRGHPFFFTNSFLKSEWDLGGERPVQDSYEIRVADAPRSLSDVMFSVWNPSEQLEKAQTTLRLQAN